MVSVVRVEDRGAVCRVTLDRPDKLNALNDDVRAAMQSAVDGLRHRTDVRVVVLAGEGRAFSAGADRNAATANVGTDPLAQRHATGAWQRLLDDFERLPQATVAQLH